MNTTEQDTLGSLYAKVAIFLMQLQDKKGNIIEKIEKVQYKDHLGEYLLSNGKLNIMINEIRVDGEIIPESSIVVESSEGDFFLQEELVLSLKEGDLFEIIAKGDVPITNWKKKRDRKHEERYTLGMAISQGNKYFRKLKT